MSFAFRFGTAGIRARLGEGAGELNRDSVRVIATAIVAELAALHADAKRRGVVVAYDGRRESRAFAREVCGVALRAGFQVGLFEQEMPTPILSFATRSLGASAGIMITASHNPADDNGLKLYLEGGRQVSGPHDARIEARIAQMGVPAPITDEELERARTAGRLVALGDAELANYLAHVRALLPSPAATTELKFGYSALYGVGTLVTRRLAQELPGLSAVELPAHASLRADFGGLASPNPEEPAALAELVALSEREGLELAFAHDPDADRLAVLVREERGALRSLSGDEVGALLGDLLLSEHPEPETTLLASTLVSGGLLEQIANSYGAAFVRAQTGFKWIAALGRARAAEQQRELLFGYEEALGYAFFSMADDKDGIAALALLATHAQRLKAQRSSLLAKLDALNVQHGLFATRQLSVVAKGADGPERIMRIMERLRALSPEALLGPGAQFNDYTRGPAPFPLLVFADRADTPNTRVCVRPSGTEPKLKVYLHVREQAGERAELVAARARAEAQLQRLATRLSPELA